MTKDPYQPDAPGWYPDPFSATGTGERYFDGRTWGTSERPRGRHTSAPTVLTTHRARRGGLARFRVPLVLLLIGALAVGLWWVQQRQRGSSPAAVEVPHPPAGTEEAAHRLLPTPSTVPGAGGYEFVGHQPGQPKTPIAFDPCRPVHYVYNPAGGPSDGLAIVRESVTRLQRVTGLKFVYDGVTTEQPSSDRALYQPGRYDASRWAPVLIAWSDEAGFPALDGRVAGATRPLGLTRSDGRSVYVSGAIVLDEKDLSAAAMPDRTLVHATVLHELGHLVGLAHTSDRTQLMFAEMQPGIVDYGAGDLHGLAVEGAQACFPDV
jgi:hypothetical protein